LSERGQAYLQQHDYRAATVDLEEALHLRPSDQDAADALASAKAGFSGGGGRMTRQHAETAATAGAQALERNDLAAAERLFSSAIDSGALPPDESELAYLDRAKARYQSGQNHSAVMDLLEAHKLSPQDSEVSGFLNEAIPKLRAQPPSPPMTAPATCATNTTSTGGFLKGKTYTVWAEYPNTTLIDAFGGAYAMFARNSWAVTANDYAAGTLAASQAVAGTPFTNTIDVSVTQAGTGVRVTMTAHVAPLLLTITTKATLCQMLQEVAQD
jgi:tetratricopeptide (TPR) repeat protein